MIDYGSGLRGNVTLSSSKTYDPGYLSFDSLTVESGVTMTVPHNTALFVSDTLTVDGTIQVKTGYPAGSGGNGHGAGDGGRGGAAGGTLRVVAKTIRGNGSIVADGSHGSNGADSGYDHGNSTGGSGSNGVASQITHTNSAEGNTANGGGGGNQYSGGGGGAGVTGLQFEGRYVEFLENWMIPGTQITDLPLASLCAGSGAGGGGGSEPDGYATGGGGGGAGGAGFGGAGGSGGSGGDGNGTNDTNHSGGGGGGSGGTGGHFVLVSDDYGDSLSLTATGGDGGNGGAGEGSNAGGGGGGGGGSGGIITAFTDTPPSRTNVNVSGGAGGSGGTGGAGNGNNGNSGEEGFMLHVEPQKLS